MSTVKIILPLFALLLISNSSQAQTTDKVKILNQISTLFDGMREGDSAKVASVFLNEATMQTITRNKDGKTVLSKGSLEAFKNAVGTPHEEVWDERISNLKIDIDAELAVAWVPYSFYRGDEFSHCGVNSFQFMKTANGWKAFSIVDTRRRTNCVDF